MGFWVTSAASSPPVLPYFFPAGMRGRGREGSRELESLGAACGDEHLEHQDADSLVGYPWERKKSPVDGD